MMFQWSDVVGCDMSSSHGQDLVMMSNGVDEVKHTEVNAAHGRCKSIATRDC